MSMSSLCRRIGKIEQQKPSCERVTIHLPWNGRDEFPEHNTGQVIIYRLPEPEAPAPAAAPEPLLIVAEPEAPTPEQPEIMLPTLEPEPEPPTPAPKNRAFHTLKHPSISRHLNDSS